MIKLLIVVPWRPQPHRIELFEIIINWYKIHFPGIEIYLSDRPGKYWNAAGSRNDGVKRAQELAVDVVIINDADTIPEFNPLIEAIQQCLKDNMVHNPYRYCKIYTKEHTRIFIERLKNNDFKMLEDLYTTNISNYSNGGVYVCTPDAWWSIGGQDEKFVQWGWEDSAFEIAHEVIKGVKLIKHDGTICSLGHKEQFHDEGYYNNYTRNTNLHNRYIKTTNAEDMLNLVKEKTIQ